MGNCKFSICRYASAILVVLGFAVCSMSSDAYAGGVHFGFGVEIPSPGYAGPPPEVVYPPPAVVERVAPPAPVVVERTAPPPVFVDRAPLQVPVVVEHAPPAVVYVQPVVVERRSSVYYYYRPSYEYHSYRVESGGGYYRQRSYNFQEEGEY